VSWQVRTLPDRYADSVRLMGIARALRDGDGVTAAEVVMGTPANLEALAALGASVDGAGPGDVVIAVDGEDGAGEAALAQVERLLATGSAPAAGDAGPAPPRTLSAATARLAGANVALVSVPGEYATLEAHRALTRGLHVFLFSDHVAIEDEVALKRRGAEHGLLVMGPECGTAMLGGAGLGFANVVRRGPVGIVAAAGTGAQEVACLLHAAGSGVSHIVGVGGRDLSETVGAVMFRQGMELLASDPQTETLLLVAKEPEEATVRELARALPAGVRCVATFMGMDDGVDGLEVHPTLEAGALAAAGATAPDETELERAVDAGRDRAAGRRVLGLYSGGSLAHEAALVLGAQLGAIEEELEAVAGDGHVVLDLGTDRFTQGRPHPMVDFTIRRDLLEEAAQDGRTGCVLLDVVCGYGAHGDPAGELTAAIAEAARQALVVVRVCGTDEDPQDARRQAAALREAGALVAPSNAAAARMAARAVGG
jgi:FdrA protein